MKLKAAVLLLLIAVATTACAYEFNLVWSAPTETVAGGPITYPLTYNVYQDGVPVLVGLNEPNATIQRDSGSYEVWVTAVGHLGTNEIESAESQHVVVDLTGPNRPDNVRVVW